MTTKLTNMQLLAFALPAGVTALVHGPVAGILPALYSAEFGINLAVIGTIIIISRIFDAVTDPVIGFLSDRTQSRYGKRKPWVAAGAALTTIATYFLFVPGDNGGAAYYLILSLLAYLAWTIIEVPTLAWVIELCRDTRERIRINAARAIAGHPQ